jgi:hypothetical protein
VTRAFIKTCLSRPIAWQPVWQPVWRQALQELLRVLPRRPVLQQELPSRQARPWQERRQAWPEQPLLYRLVLQQVFRQEQPSPCPQERRLSAWLRSWPARPWCYPQEQQRELRQA